MNRARLFGTAAALLILAAAAFWWTRRPQPAADPRTAAQWYERGRELAQDSRDLPVAIAAYRTALALEPGSAETHYGLGLALLHSGDAEGAAAEIESALSLAPPDAAWRKEAEDAMVLALLRKGKREPR